MRIMRWLIEINKLHYIQFWFLKMKINQSVDRNQRVMSFWILWNQRCRATWCFRQNDSKMWPYVRLGKAERVAELKTKFSGNQNVKNGIGVSGRTPRTSTGSGVAVDGYGETVNGAKPKNQSVNARKVSDLTTIWSMIFRTRFYSVVSPPSYWPKLSVDE